MKTNKIIAFTCLFVAFLGCLSAQTANPYDILINEFMPAPAASNIALPNAEYIELFNRTRDTFKLKGYKIINGRDTITLSDNHRIKPMAYVVIYTKKSTVDFSKFTTDTLQVTKSLGLSNPSDFFYLVRPDNVVIDAASYDLTLYQNVDKPEAGLALERIRPNEPCNNLAWTPATNANKGTPGKYNSVSIALVENTTPLVERYYVSESGKTIFLTFDKSLNRIEAILKNQYQIIEGIKVDTVKDFTPTYSRTSQTSITGNVKVETVKFLETEKNATYTTVELTLDTALKKEILYKLIIQAMSKNCQGLEIPLKIYNTLYIQRPQRPDSNLIINEILINPEVRGSRFVEFYNRSTRAMDIGLGDLRILDSLRNDSKPILTNFLLFPKQYVVLTDNVLYIQKRYKSERYRFSIIKTKLPAWNESSSGKMIFHMTVGTKIVVLDSFSYEKSWHNPLLATTEGVSLERINPNLPSSSPSNWQSAAEGSNFGTPAQQNSQFRTFKEDPSVSSPFWLEKNSFSPDGDGFEDALLIRYKLEKSGGVANISIFDSNGRLAKSLSTNELLGAEGTLRWQGERADNTEASVGIYILVIDMVYPNGSTTRQKLPCALTTQF
jgi:Lamin Tail Domain